MKGGGPEAGPATNREVRQLEASARRFEPAIWEYLESQGARVIEVVDVLHPQRGTRRFAPRAVATPRSSSVLRVPLRVTLSDGRAFKLTFPAVAAKVDRSLRALESVRMECFAPVVAAGERSVLTRWIEGSSFDIDDADTGMIERCGALQATLHCRPVPSMAVAPRDPSEWWVWLQRSTDELVEQGVLVRAHCDAVLDRANSVKPATAECTWVHRDFCPENFVVTKRGRLAVIDNESMDLGIPEYDLGRTWSRWPMPPQCWESYLRGYATRRNPGRFVAEFAFWAAVALAGSIHSRWRYDVGEIEPAVQRWSQLARPSYPALPAGAAIVARSAVASGRIAERTYHRSGLRLHVRADATDDLRWLDEFLLPWFDAEEERGQDASCATVEVVLSRDAAKLRRARQLASSASRGPRRAFRLCSGWVELPSFAAEVCDGHQLGLVDQKFDVAYLIAADPASRIGAPVPVTEVVAAPGHDRARLALMRVVREYLQEHLRRERAIVVHAAAVAVGGAQVLFAGPKGVGKTTLLAHCLYAGGAAAGRSYFVANDRVELRCERNGIMGFGIPTIISLRPGALDLVRGLEGAFGGICPPAETRLDVRPAAHKQRLNGPLHVSPAQFCRGLQATPVAGGLVRAILMLRQGGSGSQFDLVRYDRIQAEQALAKCAFGASLSAAEDTSGVFVPQPTVATLVESSTHSFATVAERVPVFACRVPAGVFSNKQAAARLLDRLLTCGVEDRCAQSL